MSTKKNQYDFNKQPPVPRTIGKVIAKPIPKEFDKVTLETIRKQKASAERNFSPSAGELLSANFHKINNAFGLNTKNDSVCKKHRTQKVTFYDPISNDFMCELCAKNFPAEQKLVPVAQAAAELQEQLFGLKHQYLTKKTHVIDRLTSQQHEIETYFKVYYDAIDKYRHELLRKEYEMRGDMDDIEIEMKRMLAICKKMGMIEFFAERNNLNDQMESIKRRLNSLGAYLPSYHLKYGKDEDLESITDKISGKVTKLIEEYIVPVDNEFSLENYRYVTQEMGNDLISDIYKMLGPFDFSAYDEKQAKEESVADTMSQASGSRAGGQQEERIPQDFWVPRRSGAVFKGYIKEDSKRPDGIGIKVHQKKSMYEGYFKNGLCHGLGRGITSRGEVYHGHFMEDEMHGFGMFYWPDGRMFEGDFGFGKKEGEGRYFWPNGQVYEGDFRNDNCSGQGILYYPDGKRYEGAWRDGAKHGKGNYIYPDGCVIAVVYQEGRKTGDGKVIAGVKPPAEKKQEHKNLNKQTKHGLDLVKQIRRQNTERYGRGNVDPENILKQVSRMEATEALRRQNPTDIRQHMNDFD